MMNTTNKIMKFAIALAALSLGACDKIAEDERYIEHERPDYDHKVLVEEFTGQLCINCPDGHEALSNIKKLYGDNVVAVSIHAGQLSLVDPFYGLRTPEGNTYAANWGVQSYPCIGVNRQGKVVNNISQWQDAVMQQCGSVADVYISLDAFVKDDELKVHTFISPSKTMKAKYQIWLTESNVKAMQMLMDNSYDFDYTHNHVYRASINGVGGEDVDLQNAVFLNMEHTFTLSKNMKQDNLSVVAFIYNEDGVLQVEERHVEKEDVENP